MAWMGLGRSWASNGESYLDYSLAGPNSSGGGYSVSSADYSLGASPVFRFHFLGGFDDAGASAYASRVPFGPVSAPDAVQTIEATGFFDYGAHGISLNAANLALAGIEGGADSLDKLAYGLAEIFVESQMGVAGLAAQARGEALANFTSLNTSAKIAGGMIAIDAVAADGDGAKLLAQLEALGLQSGSSYSALAGGLIPIDRLGDLEGIENLSFARPVYTLSHVGLVTEQPYQSMNVDVANSTYGVTGSGVTVGALSDSFAKKASPTTTYAQDLTNGDLSPVNVVKDYTSTGTDEGRAMLQAVHDIAPNANLAFYTANISMADFANGIVTLSQTCDIVVDDIIYFAEPMLQDGIVAQAVGTATANGAMYFSSAGNQSDISYEGAWRASTSTINITGTNAGTYTLMDFDPGAGVDTIQKITKTGTLIGVLNWDSPSASASPGVGSQNDLALIFYNAAGTAIASANANNINADAIEILQSSGAVAGVGIGLRQGSVAPTFVKYMLYASGSATTDPVINEYDSKSGTAVGHTNAATAISVGASDWVDSSRYGTYPVTGYNFPYGEEYTSKGGIPIYYDRFGNRLATPEYRSTVDLTASDGGNNSFFGSDVSYDTDTFPNFYGTSQAAPNAAAVAALLMEKFPTATNAQIEAALKASALDIQILYTGEVVGTGSDVWTGTGLIQADKAIQLLQAALPTLTINDVSKVEGEFGTKTFTFTVTLDHASTSAVTFDIATANGTAIAPGDFTAKSLTSQTIAAGQTTYTFDVAVNADSDIEPDETFKVNVTNVSGAVVGDGQGQGTIVNDDENDVPDFRNNTGDTLLEGGTATIDHAELFYEDDRTASRALTYTVTDATDHGVLYRDGVAVGLGGTFTQGDIDDGLVTYIHDGSETTSDSFSFMVDDGQGGTSLSNSFTFTINPVDDPATARNDSNDTSEDGVASGDVLANDSDPDSDLIVTKVNGQAANVGEMIVLSSGARLTLSANGIYSYDTNGSFDYLAEGQSVTDSFTYTVNGDDSATVTITINGVDDAAVAVDDDFSTDEDVILNSGNLLTNDSDIDSPLAVTKVNGSAADVGEQVRLDSGALLTVNANGTFSYDQNGAFDTLAAGETATETFTYEVNGGLGTASALASGPISFTAIGSNVATVTITINGVDDAATAGEDTFSTDEDTALTTGNVLDNDSDPDSKLRVTAVNGVHVDVGEQIILAYGARLTLNADGTFRFDPNNGFEDLDAGESRDVFFTYQVNGDAFTIVTITVDGVEDAAIARDDDYSVGEDGVLNRNVLNNDSDPDDPLAVTAVNGRAMDVGEQIRLDSGALLSLNADGTFSYDPNGKFEGLNVGETATDSFTYTANGDDDATVTITINGADDPATARADAFSTDEDHALTTGNVLVNDSDPDSNLRVTDVNGSHANVGEQIVLASGALLTLDANGTFSYDPFKAFQDLDDGESRDDTFTYTVNGDDTATVTVTVNGIDDAANARDDDYSVGEDGVLETRNVLNNDSDPDDPLTVTKVNGRGVDVGERITLDSGAKLTLNADGTFSYDTNGKFESLNVGDTATDTFTYTANGDDDATVTITINGADDAAVATDDDFVIDEDTDIPPLYSVLTNDQDVDDDKRVTAVNGSHADVGEQITLASGAKLTLNADGTFAYDTNGKFEDLDDGEFRNDTFTYTVNGDDEATVTIRVNGIDDAAVANDDRFDTREDATVDGNLLTNDTDPDDPLSIAKVNGMVANVGEQMTLASGALLTVNADGTFSFDPNHAYDTLPKNQRETVTFNYELSDGDTATATIVVHGVDTDDVVYGTADDDTLHGGLGDDVVLGRGGADDLSGNVGDDLLDGGAGADKMRGGNGDDRFIVDDAGDRVLEGARSGTDTVYSEIASYTLTGNVERLVLRVAGSGTGNGLNNQLIGSHGADTLSGRSGDDILLGGDGRDTLDGGAGKDLLTGGSGVDTLTGGNGADRFVFGEGDSGATLLGADRITDFSRKGGDIIDLRAIDANEGGGDSKFTFIGQAQFSMTAGELRFEKIAGETHVFGDTDGDGAADFALVLSGKVDLVETSFYL